MNERIQQALSKQFAKYRIVFWYDAERELRKDFEALELPEVKKEVIENNEFGLKYRLLREEADQKFLVYKEGPQPADVDNWLLDVQLAHGEFRTDQASIWLADLELGYEFSDVVRQHAEFFNAKKRREALKRLISSDDTASRIRLKMLAVCAGADARLDSVLENLLDDHADNKTDREALIGRCNLTQFLWEQVRKRYGYDSESPGIHDFVIELFKSCYAMATDGDVRMNSEALVFLKRWKDSLQHKGAFENISEQCSQHLAIETDLNGRDYRDLVELDYFELIDRKILSDLVSQVLERTLTAGECTQTIRGRRTSHWFAKYADDYDAIERAAHFVQTLGSVNIEIESLAQGMKAYTESLFRVDQLYRQFVYHFRKSGHVTLLEKLAEDVCNHYTNSFLRPLGDHWQEKVDELQCWKIPNAATQDQFYNKSVHAFQKKKQKVFVIISDALRYEVGEELASRIRQEDRYDAKLGYMVTKLPSYTQLGMAALLPHETLGIKDDKSATVEVDGRSSQGIANRGQILDSATEGKATAFKAEDILSKNRDECRELTREHSVVYIYQNRIDKTGHTRDTEKNAFSAAEEAMDEIVKIIKKLTSANASNILITADHGFLYQDEVEESDFSVAQPSGDICFSDRRFVLGHGLEEVSGVKKFTAAQLGLAGELDVLVPKSINRFRKSGSATRFVHGGCTLQEIVVPVVEINKRRASDVTCVEVDLIPSSSSVISSGQLAVAFYQTTPVTDKVQSRTLRAGIFAASGQLISDQHDLIFDLTSENPREREIKLRLVLSKEADAFNQQQVLLKLEELISGTSHYKDYKSIAYTLRRSFTSDFDFE